MADTYSSGFFVQFEINPARRERRRQRLFSWHSGQEHPPKAWLLPIAATLTKGIHPLLTNKARPKQNYHHHHHHHPATQHQNANFYPDIQKEKQIRELDSIQRLCEQIMRYVSMLKVQLLGGDSNNSVDVRIKDLEMPATIKSRPCILCIWDGRPKPPR